MRPRSFLATLPPGNAVADFLESVIPAEAGNPGVGRTEAAADAVAAQTELESTTLTARKQAPLRRGNGLLDAAYKCRCPSQTGMTRTVMTRTVMLSRAQELLMKPLPLEIFSDYV